MKSRLASSVLVLAACSAMEQADVAVWRDAIEGAGGAARSVAEEGPLGVLDAMTLANRGSETLAIAGEDYVQALLARRRAAAAFLPTLALVPTFAWNEVTGVRRATALDVPVDASFALNPVRDTEQVIAEGASAEQRRALLLDVQDRLLLDVARTFYDVIRAERAVGVLENSVRVQDQRVADAEARLAAGLIRPLDVSSTRAQAAATRADLTAARNRVRTGRALLAQLVTSAIGDRALVDTLEIPAAEASLDQLVGEAERRRPDLEAAAHRVDAARAQVRAAYGEYFPSISVDLDAFLRRESEPASLDWTSLLVVSQPLFSAGVIEADVRGALSELRQARAEQARLERVVRREVETAYLDVASASERVGQLGERAAAARDALAQAEGLYDVGLATNLEALVARDRMLAAELDLVGAELDRKTFHLELMRAAGSLHELLGITRPEPTVGVRDGDAEAG